MVRKSERNKGNTEKVEKPSTSRKSTRSTRRRKKSTSESEPEAEVHEEATNEVPAPAEEVPTVETAEVPEQKENRRGRGRPKRQAPTDDAPAPSEEQTEKKEEWNEDENFWGETSKKAPPETAKVDETSTWKIQSSNGSGGEIQKLKICRQRLTDSAESSSSPAKEVSSPRRKRYRKRKERHLEDGADSTGSHTDNEAPSSSVGDAAGAVCDAANANEDVEPAINEEILVTQDEIVIETQEAEIVEVIQENEAEPSESPQENEADSVASTVAVREESPIADEPSESGGVVETETVVQDVDQSPVQVTENEEIGAIQASLKETEVPSTEILVTSVGDDHGEIIEDQVVVDSEQVVVEGDPEPEPEQSEPGLEQSEPVPEPEPEKPQSVPEPEQSKPVSKRVTESAVSEPSEPPEVESTTPAKKTHKKNLKLAVSHEDAMQQIAMKLNERAARFSKEATEEASRRLVPAKPPKSERVEEEEEEGEISRNTTATKTLELKRLDDDDVEPSNKKRARCRRPISDTAATSPSTPIGAQPASEASVYDVSTVVLKTLLDVVHPLSEEEVQSIFNPKEDDVDPQMHFDDVGSTGDAGEIEEEGELIEEESEDKKRSSDDRHKHSNERKASRDEKKSERRVTKESSKRGSRDRKDSRSSVDEPRPKKKYEREVSKKEIRRSGEKSDHGEAPRNEENHKIVRKISIVSEDAKTFRRSVSPPTKKPSPVLFITNLVRPFTLAQLRELLARTGTIAPNGFVMDKIKSKCFVKYTDVEMAIETRHALHGVKWPTTNPRLLRVEFSSDEAMEAVKRLAEEEDDAAKRQDLVAQGIDKSWLTERDFIKSSRKPKNLVREWDMGKDVGEVVPAQEGLKKGKEEEWGVKAKEKRVDKEDGRRRPISPSQENSEPARKIKRREPDAPAKLLNDLFRKTKATPCIYWLPLTAEQIAVKEEMRRQHMAEHQKRLAEMRKSESSRRDKDKSRDRDRERERARERRRK